MDQRRLIFLISAPRSGSTLLQRMLGSHSQIMTHPEPHILTPLAHLGYYHKVDRAAFNVGQAQQALKHYVQNLPHAEADYLDACRAYSNTLYDRMLSTSSKQFFLDKTPGYGATILPFIERLYPDARYIVLTRHPVAILSSQAKLYCSGDFDKALWALELFRLFVPSIGQFINNKRVDFHHLQYEDLVTEPEYHLDKIFQYLGLPMESTVVDYGQHDHIIGIGDHKVNKHQRPVKTSVLSWAAELAGDGHKLKLVRKILSELKEEDLQAWGYNKYSMLDELSTGTIIPQAGLNTLTYRSRIKYRFLRYLRHWICRWRIDPWFARLQRMLDRLIKCSGYNNT